jgi:adenosylhomocysteine nucleosidase
MKFGIIAAMPQELKILVEHLQDKAETNVLGRTYYQGRIGQHDVVLVQSGIGKVMSAMSVSIAKSCHIDIVVCQLICYNHITDGNTISNSTS